MNKIRFSATTKRSLMRISVVIMLWLLALLLSYATHNAAAGSVLEVFYGISSFLLFVCAFMLVLYTIIFAIMSSSMDTIKRRAESYAQRIKEEQEDAYIFTDVEVLVEEAYEAGAREERQLLTAMNSKN